MKPAPFIYHRPSSLPETVALLARLENAKLLAGGQSLMPMLNLRLVAPDHLIDIARLPELGGIAERDGRLVIGAGVCQRDVERSDLVARVCPVLVEALQQVGHQQTRNRGTIGGSLCHLDPAAELPALAMALDATVHIAGPRGARDVDFAVFPAGYLTPALAPDELVTAIALPIWPAGHGYGFEEFSRRHGDFAVVAAVALLALVTVSGIGPAPVRVAAAEALLVGASAEPALFAAAAAHAGALDAHDDLHASASYRRRLARVLSERALLKAYDRASPHG
jgi:carbon-monoxide dehydrogenase medium subunit